MDRGYHQFPCAEYAGRPPVCICRCDKKARKELFDSHRLAKALGAASEKEVKPEALALGRLSVSKGLDTLRFVFNNQRWMYASRKNQLVNEGAVPPYQAKALDGGG